MNSSFKIYVPFSRIVLLGMLALLMGCKGNPVSSTPQIAEPTAFVIPSPTSYDPMPQTSDGFYWWNKVVFYEIFVRSFADSNGDGIGDLNGIIQKLDYLNDGNPDTDSDLGINAIWLMPIYPASSYHGYDVIDYYDINPQYGTLEDLKNLLSKAHQRGIRVIIDFVINHTSSKHPWFIDARSNPASQYRAWYIWSIENPGYSGPWGERVWHFNYDGQYYYGVFTAEMPDLNFVNAKVTQEVYKIARFWIEDVGVDGFRVDGARHLIEDGKIQANSSATYRWFEQFQFGIKQMNSQFLTIGEVWDSNFAAVKYVKNDAFDLVFDFELSESILAGLNRSDAKKISNALEFNFKLYPQFQKANFLTNHDMNRVMDALLMDVNKAKLAAILLLTSPGVPFIYYGEEIGMAGSKPDENIRKPMQWDSSVNSGFSNATPWQSLNSEYKVNNVAELRVDQNSLFTLYRELIQLRNGHISLQTGEFILIDTKNTGIIAFLRKSSQETILVLINLGKEKVPLTLDLSVGTMPPEKYNASVLLSSFQMDDFEMDAGKSNSLFQGEKILNPEDYLLISLQKK